MYTEVSAADFVEWWKDNCYLVFNNNNSKCLFFFTFSVNYWLFLNFDILLLELLFKEIIHISQRGRQGRLITSIISQIDKWGKASLNDFERISSKLELNKTRTLGICFPQYHTLLDECAQRNSVVLWCLKFTQSGIHTLNQRSIAGACPKTFEGICTTDPEN